MEAQQRSDIVILVIDDDPDLVDTLTDALELVGRYTVVSARDGAQGLEEVAAAHPDCIVVDVRMPQVNGLQFVLALRGDRSTEEIPIVMLSAMIQDQDELRGLFSGADAYLRKPVRIAELLKAIDQALRLTAVQRVQRLAALADDHAPLPTHDTHKSTIVEGHDGRA